MAAATPDFEALVAHLAAQDVEFVLVGGLAAVALGAPVATFAVDIVHRRTAENVDRLIKALAAVDAHYRGRPPGQILRPKPDATSGPGHHQLRTRLGDMDVLGSVEGEKTYDDLAPRTESVEIRGRTIRVLSLEALIELKEPSTRPRTS